MRKLVYGILSILFFATIFVVACQFELFPQSFQIEYYVQGVGGAIEGSAVQHIIAGKDAKKVEAIPDDGYVFVEWSDGVQTAERTDTNITADMTVYAKFEAQTFKVEYKAEENGYIEGLYTQSVKYGQNTTTVVAVPNAGYEFISWSDGVETAERNDTNIASSLIFYAKFEAKTLELEYKAEENGYIEGLTSQVIKYGQIPTKVTAVAEYGYQFVGWSDGIMTAERQDSNSTSSLTVTAKFKQISKVFTYNYKFGVATPNEKTVTLSYFNMNSTVLPVPTREHFTFDGWYCEDKQVANSEGNLIEDYELLYAKSSELWAKWTANETFTYKILLVYVTEIDATLTSMDKTKEIEVKYKMTDVERQICHNTTILLKRKLDDITDGLVEFQVDEYFTEMPVTTSDFKKVPAVGAMLEAWQIPEVVDKGLTKKYNSLLTTINLNDYEMQVHNCSGQAGAKYGTLHTEMPFYQYYLGLEPIEKFLDLNYYRWETFINNYIHELAHTIELNTDEYLFDFHKAIRRYNYHYLPENEPKLSDYECYKLYFLNEVDIDGEKVGIPYEFWAGELKLILT